MLAMIFNKILRKNASNPREILQKFMLVGLTQENPKTRDLKI